jgi:hypothetical protein
VKACDLAVQGSVCNGNGACLRIGKTACNADAQCLSNVCSDYECLGLPNELCEKHEECVSGTCAIGACK